MTPPKVPPVSRLDFSGVQRGSSKKPAKSRAQLASQRERRVKHAYQAALQLLTDLSPTLKSDESLIAQCLQLLDSAQNEMDVETTEGFYSRDVCKKLMDVAMVRHYLCAKAFRSLGHLVLCSYKGKNTYGVLLTTVVTVLETKHHALPWRELPGFLCKTVLMLVSQMSPVPVHVPLDAAMHLMLACVMLLKCKPEDLEVSWVAHYTAFLEHVVGQMGSGDEAVVAFYTTVLQGFSAHGVMKGVYADWPKTKPGNRAIAEFVLADPESLCMFGTLTEFFRLLMDNIGELEERVRVFFRAHPSLRGKFSRTVSAEGTPAAREMLWAWSVETYITENMWVGNPPPRAFAAKILDSGTDLDAQLRELFPTGVVGERPLGAVAPVFAKMLHLVADTRPAPGMQLGAIGNDTPNPSPVVLVKVVAGDGFVDRVDACPICLEAFVVGDALAGAQHDDMMRNVHWHHAFCLNEWWRKTPSWKTKLCPVCKQPGFKEDIRPLELSLYRGSIGPLMPRTIQPRQEYVYTEDDNMSLDEGSGADDDVSSDEGEPMGNALFPLWGRTDSRLPALASAGSSDRTWRRMDFTRGSFPLAQTDRRALVDKATHLSALLDAANMPMPAGGTEFEARGALERRRFAQRGLVERADELGMPEVHRRLVAYFDGFDATDLYSIVAGFPEAESGVMAQAILERGPRERPDSSDDDVPHGPDEPVPSDGPADRGPQADIVVADEAEASSSPDISTILVPRDRFSPEVRTYLLQTCPATRTRPPPGMLRAVVPPKLFVALSVPGRHWWPLDHFVVSSPDAWRRLLHADSEQVMHRLRYVRSDTRDIVSVDIPSVWLRDPPSANFHTVDVPGNLASAIDCAANGLGQWRWDTLRLYTEDAFRDPGQAVGAGLFEMQDTMGLRLPMSVRRLMQRTSLGHIGSAIERILLT